jgi:hypothetical protein
MEVTGPTSVPLDLDQPIRLGDGAMLIGRYPRYPLANSQLRGVHSDYFDHRIKYAAPALRLLFFLWPHDVEATTADDDNRYDECNGRPIHGCLP